MPRYRTISCAHCGFMQLKRDYFCEGCNSLTLRAKVELIAKVAQLVVIALAVCWLYSEIQTLIPH